MPDSRRAVSLGYYAILVVLLVLAITNTLHDVFPRQLAKHVGEDSEGLLLALLLPLWIQYARPRLTGTDREWPATAVVAVVMLAVGLVCYQKDGVPPRIATLNETFLALAVLIPYVQLRRPLPRALALGLPAAVLLLVLVDSGNTLVTNLAEGVIMLVLAPVGLDVVDRAVLQKGRWTPPPARALWYAFLVVAPIVVVAMEHHFGGAIGTAVRYAERVQESFVGVLLVELYLAVALGRVAARRTAGQPAD